MALSIVLAPPSEEEIQSFKKAESGGPLVIGFHRDPPGAFDDDLSPQLDWTELSDGSFVTSVSVTTPEAEAVRVGIRAGLSSGGEIRFFRPGSDERLPLITQEDFHFVEDAMETLWSPTVDGDTIGIEISLPSAKAVDAFSLMVDKVAHTFVPTDSLPEAPKALDCPHLHIDIACRDSSVVSGLEDAVVRLRYEKDGRSRVCSGTVLTDKDKYTRIPYILTSQHCVSTSTVARTVEAYWFYQKARCSSSSLDSRRTRTSGGADVLSSSYSYDLSLLRLRDTVPAGVTLSGWTSAAISHSASVYAIHHPDGTVKKYSAGSTLRNADSSGRENLIHVRWSEGTMEGGSSGGGLFLRSTGQLVGAHSRGPEDSCSRGDIDKSGPFRYFFPQVKRWLFVEGSPPPPTDDHGNTPETATLMLVGWATEAYLEQAGDIDYFKFTTTESARLHVYTTGQTDTYGTLTRSTGGDGQSDDDSGEGQNFSIDLPNAPPGDYFIRVRGARTTQTTGVYTLHIRQLEVSLGEADHVLPLIIRADDPQRQGFVRLINNSSSSGTVTIHAIDVSGNRFGPGTLNLDAKESLNFNSVDLEQGNSALGLTGVGTARFGDWRVELRTDLEIEARAYIRTPDGFLTSMQDVAEESPSGSMRYYIPFFNPASNTSLVSWLRLTNLDTAMATVEISGVDADGRPGPGGSMRVFLSPKGTRTLDARILENAEYGLGDGRGKWQLWVSSDRPLQVMNLLWTRSGHLSNLSR